MITLGLICAGLLGMFGVLRQLEGRPALCPQCMRPTLMPDRGGVTWRCVPCQAQYIYSAGRYHPRTRSGPDGDEAIPTATLRKPDDD